MPAKVTLDDVLEERRKELIGEGHRMFDLLRNNLRVTRINETDDMMKEVVHFADEKHLWISTETIIVQYYLFLKKKLMLILILYKHQNI